jgi:hypothetical protein
LFFKILSSRLAVSPGTHDAEMDMIKHASTDNVIILKVLFIVNKPPVVKPV